MAGIADLTWESLRNIHTTAVFYGHEECHNAASSRFQSQVSSRWPWSFGPVEVSNISRVSIEISGWRNWLDSFKPGLVKDEFDGRFSGSVT